MTTHRPWKYAKAPERDITHKFTQPKATVDSVGPAPLRNPMSVMREIRLKYHAWLQRRGLQDDPRP